MFSVKLNKFERKNKRIPKYLYIFFKKKIPHFKPNTCSQTATNISNFLLRCFSSRYQMLINARNQYFHVERGVGTNRKTLKLYIDKLIDLNEHKQLSWSIKVMVIKSISSRKYVRFPPFFFLLACDQDQ